MPPAAGDVSDFSMALLSRALRPISESDVQPAPAKTNREQVAIKAGRRRRDIDGVK